MPLLQQVLDAFKDCADLQRNSFPELGVEVVFFKHLAGADELARDLAEPFSNVRTDEVPLLLTRAQYRETVDFDELVNGILDGSAAIFFDGKAYLIDVYKPESRSIMESETETIMTGPHEAFVERAIVNLHLIRSRLKSSRLKTVKLKVGEVTKTDVYVLYVDGIADAQLVNEMIRRIQTVETDSVLDGNMLAQLINDAPNSIFSVMKTSERCDLTVSMLTAGKVVVLMDGSPFAISAPSTFFEFFSSPDDYYLRWPLGTATRLLRFVALLMTLLFTAGYVAITTYHYEMLPGPLLVSLAESRVRVPFPPIIEALFMETIIEMLREAGARLPTKIGQTIGIVGGIVIGQAVVAAGLTSNILIIVVASSAIASYVIPSYIMSSSIRLARFGLILLAGFLGNFGIIAGITMIAVHLAGLSSLNQPFLSPVAPFRPKEWLDTFIRAPFRRLNQRPKHTKTPNPRRMKMRK